MEPLIIEGTETTLQVDLIKSEGLFKFEGRSRPENIASFFEPIFDWFNKYETDPNPETIIQFNLDYFNSSSAKVLLRLFVRIEEMFEKGLSVKVHWQYLSNDEDLLEAGHDFSSVVKVPFEFIEIE